MRIRSLACLFALSAGFGLAAALATSVPATACGAGSRMVRPDGSVVHLRCGFTPHRQAAARRPEANTGQRLGRAETRPARHVAAQRHGRRHRP